MAEPPGRHPARHTTESPIYRLASVDLNLLIPLYALLTERSVTRAARRVGLSQPAMSALLSRLRRLFQDDLLTRVGREYYLTPLGQQLVGPMEEVLRDVADLLRLRPQFNPQRDAYTFSIVASDYATIVLLHPLLKAIAHEYPNMRLVVHRLAADSFEKLDRQEIDMVIAPYEVSLFLNLPRLDPGRFSHQVLFTDEWVCAVWAGNQDVGERLTMDQFRSMKHLVFGLDEFFPMGLADVALESLGVRRPIQCSVNSFLLLPLLLTGTSMVAMVQRRLAKLLLEKLRDPDVLLLEPPFDAPRISEAMFWHPSKTEHPAHRWLREAMAAVGKELGE
ncbi:Nodulation protein D 2 [bacterium HR24]|nr:Nodulation protein D 2 [bacterium HR24]